MTPKACSIGSLELRLFPLFVDGSATSWHDGFSRWWKIKYTYASFLICKSCTEQSHHPDLKLRPHGLYGRLRQPLQKGYPESGFPED